MQPEKNNQENGLTVKHTSPEALAPTIYLPKESRLQPVAEKAIETLPVSLKHFIQNLNTGQISTADPGDAETAIYAVILKSMERAGHQKKNEDMDAVLNLAADVYSLIKSKFISLTIGEFEEACLNGCVGLYGPFFGFSLKTICDWVKEYLNTHERKQAIKEWHKAIDETVCRRVDKPVSDMLKMDKEHVIKGFDHYVETGNLPIAPFAHYECINKMIGEANENGNKTLFKDPVDRAAIKKSAKFTHERHIAQATQDAQKNGQFAKAREFEEMLDFKQNKLFHNVLKTEALKKFYKKLITENKHLKDLL